MHLIEGLYETNLGPFIIIKILTALQINVYIMQVKVQEYTVALHVLSNDQFNDYIIADMSNIT